MPRRAAGGSAHETNRSDRREPAARSDVGGNMHPRGAVSWSRPIGTATCLALAVLPTLLGCSGAGAGTATVPPPALSPAPPTSSTATPGPVSDAAGDPDETRCGVDDGPIPIGSSDEAPLRPLPRAGSDRDLLVDGPFLPGSHHRDGVGVGVRVPVLAKRMAAEMAMEPPPPEIRGAPMGVAITWRGAEASALASLPARATACGDDLLPADAGVTTIHLRLATSGAALATRADVTAPVKPSSPEDSEARKRATRLRKCLEAAACGAQMPPGSTSATLLAEVRVEPPVFHGQVRSGVSSLDPSASVRSDHLSRRGRRFFRAPPAQTPAFRELAGALGVATLAVGTRCAEQLPPAGSFVMSGSFEIPKGGGAPKPTQPAMAGADSYERKLQACLVAGTAKLTVPSTTGRVENVLVEWTFSEVGLVPSPPQP